jgi:23S rRNA (guanosine2251-2'-O)-methyltransferase
VQEALLRGARPIGRVLLTASRWDARSAEILKLAKQRGVPVSRVPQEAMRRRVPGGLPHQGILAEVAPRAYADPEELLRGIDEESLFVVLDGVQDPQNLGAIIRTAAAVGARGIFLPAKGAASLGPAAIRASAGTAAWLPVARTGSVSGLLERLGGLGILRIGLDPAANDLYTAIPGDRPIALILGSEEKGLSRPVREACDILVRVPIPGKVGSLNVSVAAGLALFEVLRARAGRSSR